MKLSLIALSVILLSILVAAADDVTDIDGNVYRDVKLFKVEPDGIIYWYKGELLMLFFWDLPKEIREKHGYQAEKEQEYKAARARFQEALKEQREIERQEAQAEAFERQARIDKAQRVLWLDSQIKQLRRELATLESQMRNNRSLVTMGGGTKTTASYGYTADGTPVTVFVEQPQQAQTYAVAAPSTLKQKEARNRLRRQIKTLEAQLKELLKH